MRIHLSGIVAAAGVLAFFSDESEAYSRAFRPLNVSVVLADVIVEAKTTRVPERYTRSGQSAEINVNRVFKGALKPGPLTVSLQPDHILALGKLKNGKDYLFFLRGVATEPAKYEVMLDGTRLQSDEDAARIASAVALSPAWSESRQGLSTLLTAENFRIKSDEPLTLWVGLRNTSDQDILLKSRDWPLDTHTYWTLEIRTEAGDKIEAAPHPTLTQEEISDYFSKFPRSFDVTLKPQEEVFFSIHHINSAKPGWGYKEDLDFKYYPMTRAGRYSIVATAHNLLSHSSVSASGLAVRVESGPPAE